MSGIEIRVCGRYRLQNILKKREKHSIYSAVNVQTEQEVIIKAEQSKGKRDSIQSLLQQGKVMQGLQGGIGIPSMHWCGQEEDYNFIVMEYLGKSLQELFSKCNKRFTLKTVLMIGDQLVNIIQYFHFKNFIHREINPSNFLIGRGRKNNKIFLIDYFNCKRFRDSKTLQHYPFKQNQICHNNLVFSSVNFHKGVDATRRDDMESMVLILIYFLKGLPWQDVEGPSLQQKSKNILKLKEQISVEQLCEGLPKEFITMTKHLRNLNFEQKPDYTYFKNVFKQIITKQGMINDFIFDWVLLPLQRIQVPIEHYPLKVEVIPNQQDFIRTHIQHLKKQEESANKDRPVEINQQPAIKEDYSKNVRESKQKDCLLF